jgi:hypothetical protein
MLLGSYRTYGTEKTKSFCFFFASLIFCLLALPTANHWHFFTIYTTTGSTSSTRIAATAVQVTAGIKKYLKKENKYKSFFLRKMMFTRSANITRHLVSLSTKATTTTRSNAVRTV